MPQLITITSKRQITIPVAMFQALGFKQGQKIIINHEKDKLTLEPALVKVEKLAGSIKIPARFRKMSLDKVIEQAKKEYFSQK